MPPRLFAVFIPGIRPPFTGGKGAFLSNEGEIAPAPRAAPWGDDTVARPALFGIKRDKFSLDTVRLYTQVQVLEHPEHQDACYIMEEWQKLRDEGRLLHAQDLPSKTFARLLPRLYLLEPANEAATDWRFRLVGTDIANAFPANPTGRAISELYAPEKVLSNAAVYRDVLEHLRPVVTKGQVEGLDRDYKIAEFVHLPVAIGEKDERVLLGGVFEHGYGRLPPAFAKKDKKKEPSAS